MLYRNIIVNIKNIEEQSDSESRLSYFIIIPHG